MNGLIGSDGAVSRQATASARARKIMIMTKIRIKKSRSKSKSKSKSRRGNTTLGSWTRYIVTGRYILTSMATKF